MEPSVESTNNDCVCYLGFWGMVLKEVLIFEALIQEMLNYIASLYWQLQKQIIIN